MLIYRNLGGRVQQLVEKKVEPKSFYAIAAFVTAYAREKMREFREMLPAETVYYQAVDALYVTPEGAEKLRDEGMVRENQLGFLTAKKKAEDCEFIGINNYRVGGVTVAGSVKRKAEKLPSGMYRELTFETFHSSMLREPDGTVGIGHREREAPKGYSGGKLLPSGEYAPIELNEESFEPLD